MPSHPPHRPGTAAPASTHGVLAADVPVAPDAVHNWCGTHRVAAAGTMFQPRTEDELRAVLRDRPHPHVHLLGARHSWPALIASEGATVISTAGLSGVLGVGDGWVDVLGGTTLAEVTEQLRPHGRRLDCSPPVISSQTVAGAVATETHGQGLRQSSISDTVESLRVVRPDGSVIELRAGDCLDGHRLALGMLGAFTRLRLRTTPNLIYTCEKRAVTHDYFLRHFAQWQHDYEFCKAWWFPEHGKVHAWLVRTATPDETQAYGAGQAGPVEWGSGDVSLNGVIDDVVDRMRIDTKTADLSRKQFQTVRRFRDFADLTGDLSDLLCKGIPVAQINCEVAIPFDAVPEAQDRLDHWYRTRQPHMHYPFILRPTGASRAWLSPAYGRDVCYYGLVIYRAEDGTFARNSYAHVDEIVRILTALGGRPHWGKYFDPALIDFSALPRVASFVQLVDEVDPAGHLRNPGTSALFELLRSAAGTGTGRSASRPAGLRASVSVAP